MFKSKLRSVLGLIASVTMVATVAVTPALALTASDIAMLQSAGIISAAQAASLSASISAAPAVMSSGYTFSTDLTIGSTGADVSALQQILVNGGYLVMPAGVSMGYFGALTQAALGKYQAANGISPTAGYFGPKTRAFVNASAGSVSVTPVTGTGTVMSGPISVSAVQSVGGTVVSPSATALLAQYTFTGNGQVNNIVLNRTGVSSDNTLNNVYLYSGATRLTDAASVANGVISFNNPNGLFTVSGSITVSVRADIAANQGGETVGVALTSLTTTGGSSVNVDVLGPTQNIANNATAAGVTIGTQTDTASAVNAGTLNYSVWAAPITVSTRSVYLDALTLKYIGSAPSSAFQNLSLFVDGTKVGTATINSNSFAVFDLSATPFVLNTGSHTFDVHADIVGGANYTGSFTLQNQADIMLADSQLQGVYVAATNQATPGVFSQNVGGVVSINAGSITVSVDPSYNTTQVAGGSTNVTIGQFLLTDYGEGVKITQLTVTPSISGAAVSTGTTSPLSLNNVALYVNGAQVGSLQNWVSTNGALTFNLGSSLVVQAGQVVTLTVKADTINAAYGNYTAGSLTVQLGGVANNAQGVTSSALSTVPSSPITSNALTLGIGGLTLSKNSAYSNQSIIANTTNQKIGSFILQANSNEDTQLTNINVGLSGTLPLTSFSNLRTSETATPVAPAVTNSFSDNSVIAANTSREIDVFADIGQIPATTKYGGSIILSAGGFASTTINGVQFVGYGATAPLAAASLLSAITGISGLTATASTTNTSAILLTATAAYPVLVGLNTTVSGLTAGDLSVLSNSTATIITTLTATAQGLTSHTPLTITGSPATGQTITVTSGALNVGSALVNTSPVAQYVIGGSTFPVAIYNAVSTVGNSTITEMDFGVNPNNSTIASVTVGGVTAPVVAGTSTVTGLNIVVPSGYAGVNIPVSVTYNSVGQNGIATNLASQLILGTVKSQNGTAAVATSYVTVPSNSMTLVASKPTIAIANPGETIGGLNGLTELIDVTVSADAAGDINLDQLPIAVNTNGTVSVGSGTPSTLLVVKDQNNNIITTATGTLSVAQNSSGTTSVSFLNGVSTGYRIPAGTSQTFKIYEQTSGSGNSGTLTVATQLGAASLFKWTDIQGASVESALTGTAIANYPTDVHTVGN